LIHRFIVGEVLRSEQRDCFTTFAMTTVGNPPQTPKGAYGTAKVRFRGETQRLRYASSVIAQSKATKQSKPIRNENKQTCASLAITVVQLKLAFTSIILLCCCAPLLAQNNTQKILLTIDNAISFAHSNSFDALEAHNTLRASHWSFQNYKAEFLPTLNFSAGIANLNRSLVALQDANTADIFYRNNFNMRNRGNFSLNQNIALTGGTLSLNSNILRLDQYSPNRFITYYSEPITLSYSQSLGGYNRFKWNKKIEPERYELAKREYLEAMGNVTLNAVSMFFNVAIEQLRFNIACKNYSNTVMIYQIALKKFGLKTITKNELMQIELKMINDSIAINNSSLQLTEQTQNLRLFLGIDNNCDIETTIEEQLPFIQLDGQQVFSQVAENSPFTLRQNIQGIEAEMEVARAKSNSGFNSQIQVQFGLSNSADELTSAYRNLLDQEIASVSLSVPIVDWGTGKRRIAAAKTQAETTNRRIEHRYREFEQEIFNDVTRFNNQHSKCLLSDKARIVANEWYELNIKNFENNSITITDLNASQNEKDEAFMNYIYELKNYWYYYYQIQKKSSYDYISNRDISAEFDELVKDN